MRIRELRAQARESLKGNVVKAAIPLFIASVVMYLIQLLVEVLTANASILGVIVGIAALVSMIVLSVILSYGAIVRSIKVARNEEVNYMKDTFGNSKLAWSATWGAIKRAILWIVLSIISCIIVGILVANESVISIVFILFAAYSIIMSVVNIYRYTLMYYLKYDYPEKSTNELLEKSRMMMKGNKAKYMVLPFTFFGWMLLCYLAMALVMAVGAFHWSLIIITTIIGYFLTALLSGYILMTQYHFYMEQKPLEVFNEGYVKPERNAKKYIWILVGVYAITAIVFMGSAALISMSVMNMLGDMNNSVLTQAEYALFCMNYEEIQNSVQYEFNDLYAEAIMSGEMRTKPEIYSMIATGGDAYTQLEGVEIEMTDEGFAELDISVPDYSDADDWTINSSTGKLTYEPGFSHNGELYIAPELTK